MSYITESVVRRSSSKYVFLKISQISHKNICVGVFFKQNFRPEGDKWGGSPEKAKQRKK